MSEKDRGPAVVEVWDNALWVRAGAPWPPEQESPTRQQNRDLEALNAMESVWIQARQEDSQRVWVAECAVTGLCAVCGLGPQALCEQRGSCSEAMREWRQR